MRRMRRWVVSRSWVVPLLSLVAAACSSKGGGKASGRSGDECDPDAGAGGPSLLTNGSFEQPLVPVGSYTTYANGQTFSGWTVVGATGNVAPLSTSFVSGPAFTAEDGQQSIDMTGTTDGTATGIQQVVTTTAGHTYCLSFWVGNVYTPGGPYGVDSTINVLVDGQMVAVVTNADQAETELSWQPFTSTVVAAGASTTIAFINGDPPGDGSNFLDNVSLR
jgi:hapalindole biogenesis HpiC1 cyclase-like protein